MTHPSEGQSVEARFLLTESGNERPGGLTLLEGVSLESVQAEFSELLDEAAFLRIGMEKLASVDQFGALVLQMDEPGEDSNPEALLLSLLRLADGLCAEKAGLWGLLGNFRVGLFFPHADESECLELAEKLQSAFLEETGKTATAGAAVYPTLAFGKPAILENAAKAAAHAEFFGPGSRVPFDAVSLNISGDQYYQKGDIDGAIQELELALALDPENVNALNSLGVCLGIRGKLDDALIYFEKAINLDPRELMPVYNAGYIHLLKKDTATALQYFHQAGQINAKVYELAFQTGRAYLETQNPIKARPYLETAVRLNPRSCAAFRLLGECYHLVERLSDAITAYKNALKINAHDAATLSALGFLYEMQGQNAEIALMFCEQGSRYDPENGLFKQRLARIYFNRGQMDDALEAFRQAHELGCDSAEYIEHITRQANTAP